MCSTAEQKMHGSCVHLADMCLEASFKPGSVINKCYGGKSTCAGAALAPLEPRWPFPTRKFPITSICASRMWQCLLLPISAAGDHPKEKTGVRVTVWADN